MRDLCADNSLLPFHPSQSQDQTSQSRPANALTRVRYRSRGPHASTGEQPPARPSVQRDEDITRGMFAAGRVLFPSARKVGKEKDGGALGIGFAATGAKRTRGSALPSADGSGTNVTSPTQRSADARPPHRRSARRSCMPLLATARTGPESRYRDDAGIAALPGLALVPPGGPVDACCVRLE